MTHQETCVCVWGGGVVVQVGGKMEVEVEVEVELGVRE